MEEVSDPTDFPDTYKDLRSLDASLRCPICQELMRAPVVLSGCGHSFCSQCVREAFDSKEECPQCRAKSSLGHLIKNTALGDVITTYERARSTLLDLVTSATTRTTLERPFKRQRLSSPDDIEEIVTSDGRSTKRNRSDNSSDAFQNTEGIIECPQCEELVELKDINVHLDNNCVTPASAPSRKLKVEGGDKKAWKAIFNGSSSRNRGRHSSPPPTTRLPKEAYDLMKDKQLRERLNRFDLSTTGSRAKLQTRHERWVVLYNANLDNPVQSRKSVSALRDELTRWEEGKEQDEKQKMKATESAGEAGDLEYQAKHRAQFQDLVHQARSSRQKKEDAETAEAISPNDSVSSS